MSRSEDTRGDGKARVSSQAPRGESEAQIREQNVWNERRKPKKTQEGLLREGGYILVPKMPSTLHIILKMPPSFTFSTPRKLH